MSTPPNRPASSVASDPDSTVLAVTQPTASGATAQPAGSSNVLPTGTRLGEFEIAGVLGEGGFGIVYRAIDHSLKREVALKEYMPAALASRLPDFSVTIKSEQHRPTFEVGLKSFINEARLLARFDHPALVKVFRFWAAGTVAVTGPSPAPEAPKKSAPRPGERVAAARPASPPPARSADTAPVQGATDAIDDEFPRRAARPLWVQRALREGRDCLVARDFACTIRRAEAVLKADAEDPAAQRLLKLARAGQEAALSSDWKMR